MIEDAGRRRPSVGVNYCSAMRELVERDGAVDLIEVEPQTIWLHAPGATAPYRVDEDALADLVALPVPKLLHGIGFPVGGTCIPDRMHLPVMREMIAALQPAWVSEHLAFNEVHTENEAFTTAFMLPPRQ